MSDRRSFIKTMAALTAGVMLSCDNATENTLLQNDRLGDLLPQRILGNTGEKVTMLGVGGAHVGRANDKTAQEIIETAIEGGIRFFDNAESYSRGGAETKYGKYLVPKYRDISFIMTKSTAQDGAKAQKHLDDSLRRMNTDYVDLWQIHAVGSREDVDQRIKNGVLDVAIKAKESGKARYIGFTGHRDYNAHLQMLERTEVLETCQMPINCFDPNNKSFINNVLPKLVEKKIGVLAMKTLSNGGFFGGNRHFYGGDHPKLVPNVLSIQEALFFAWSLPISVLITGAHDADMLREKIELARTFKEMEEQERLALVQRVADSGYDGSIVEFYKS